MPVINHATYLDRNSGAPLHPFVVEALFSFLRSPDGSSGLIANPSSLHADGRRARKLIRQSQDHILSSLGVDSEAPHPWEVTFVSNGTDANQTAIRSALVGEKLHWILSPTEHPSVLNLVQWFQEERGGEVSYLPISPQGEVKWEEIEKLIQPGRTGLVSLMAANNEVGTTSHIQSVFTLTQKHRIPFHTDCIASWGKTEIDLSQMSPDFVTLSPYKVGGLSGLGILVHKKHQTIWNPFIGSQQGGRRGGVENLLGILAAGAAAQTISEQIEVTGKLVELRERLAQWLKQEIPQIKINGENAESRLGHVLHLTVSGQAKNLSLATQFDLAGISLSSGSACSSGSPEPSHVLLAMGLRRMDALNSIRVSLSSATDWETCLKLGHTLKRIISNAGNA